jgi:hypothetical protein
MNEEEQELNRQLAIVEDVYSTRAVAHASFFVASLFGLFTILALILMERLSITSSVLLSITYWLVWSFGLFSFLNFSRYATRANRAIEKTASEATKLVSKQIENATCLQDKIVRWFEGLRSDKWLRNRDKTLFIIAYIAIGLFGYVAFLFR